jgi:hypothetical protein
LETDEFEASLGYIVRPWRERERGGVGEGERARLNGTNVFNKLFNNKVFLFSGGSGV